MASRKNQAAFVFPANPVQQDLLSAAFFRAGPRSHGIMPEPEGAFRLDDHGPPLRKRPCPLRLRA